jgi:hypothetical protein
VQPNPQRGLLDTESRRRFGAALAFEIEQHETLTVGRRQFGEPMAEGFGRTRGIGVLGLR